MNNLKEERIKKGQYYIVWTYTKQYCANIDRSEVEKLLLDETRKLISNYEYLDPGMDTFEEVVPFKKVLANSLHRLLEEFPIGREGTEECHDWPSDIEIKYIEPVTLTEASTLGKFSEEIKDKRDIVKIISEYVKLNPTTLEKKFKGKCPFCKSENNNFMVSPSNQSFHCFDCGAGTNIVDFIMRLEKVDFSEAVKILAKKAGIKIPREMEAKITDQEKVERIYGEHYNPNKK